MHGSDAQSSMFTSQVIPVKPLLHKQVKVPDELSDKHIPSFWHGDDRHKSVNFSQFSPVNRSRHLHWYPGFWFIQVPLFSHGSSSHSLISFSQCEPFYPSAQRQV